MRKTFFVLTLLGLSLAATARAEVLAVPDSVAAAPVSTPERGSTQAAVLKAYGQPVEQYAPVGGGHPKRPPITRWDYERVSVFFERDLVVDVVVKGQPAPVSNVDELKPQY